MKPALRSLRTGESVWALIEEVLSQDELLVNFSGDLVRVKNNSRQKFRSGQRISLRVEALIPLEMSLISPRDSSLSPYRRSKASLDVSI